jgi:hypothetical protein
MSGADHRGSAASALLAVCVLAIVPLLGQDRGAATVITAFNGGPTASYRAPRTAWGDPSLEGVWSSDDLRTVPLQRDPAFGTRLYLDDAEYADKLKRDADIRNLGVVGANRNDIWQEVSRRTWRQTSLVVDPPDGRIPMFTPGALKRRAARDRGSYGDGPFDTVEDFTLNDRCITRGVVGSVLPAPYGNGHRIFQAPGMVVVTYEMIHDTRVINTDGRPHIGSRLHQYLGDSRGRWEGDSLVVETRNLTDRTSIGAGGIGIRHSAEMTLIERFTRVAADVLQYQVTIHDPLTYASSFTISMPLTPPQGDALLPYECHEGNYSLANALSGGRAADRDSPR